MSLTNNDLKKISEITTKNNKHLVTKDDLIVNNKNLVTKNQLSSILKANNELIIHQMEDKFVTKEEIKHLPTKKEFYESEDRLIKEIKDLREEVIVQGHQVRRNTKKIEKLERSAFSS